MSINPNKKVIVFYRIIYFLNLVFVASFLIFIPKWIFYSSMEEIKNYFPNYGVFLFYYMSCGLYIQIGLILSFSWKIISKQRFKFQHISKKILIDNIYRVNWMVLLLVFFSVLSMRNTLIFPSIIFPDFKNVYERENGFPSLVLSEIEVIDEKNKVLNLYEFQKPNEIHNYFYLKLYLLNKDTKDNALDFLQKKYFSKTRNNKTFTVLQKDTIINFDN